MSSTTRVSKYGHGNGNSPRKYDEVVMSPNPPMPHDPSGVYSGLFSEAELTGTRKKFVKVSGHGEIDVEPDRVDFCIRISTVKGDLAEARSSVKKREDYLLSTCRRCSIRPVDISISEQVGKIEKEESQDEYRVSKELYVTCDSLVKYLQIASTVSEKLDGSVVVSDPIIKFSPAHIQTNTQKALRLAVSNAQQNAGELVSSQRGSVSLGPLVYTVQDSHLVENQEEYAGAPLFETFKWKKHNKRISLKITSVYEIIAKGAP